MANATLTLTIASTLQKAGFTEAAEHMRKMQADLDNVGKKTDAWKEATNKLKEVFSKVAVFEFYRRSAEEAGKAEETQLRLKTTIENTGLSWDRVGARVNEVNRILSENSRFSKGDLDNSLQILVQRTNDLAVAQANLHTVMGVSVVTGRSLADVADQVGRAANGSQRDIMQLAKEFGITGANAKNADFVLETLSKRFGDVAEKENTYNKITAQAKNAWDNLKESFGNLVGGPIEDIISVFTRIIGILGKTIDVLVNVDKASVRLFKGDWKGAMEAGKAAAEDYKEAWMIALGKIPAAIDKSGPLTTAAVHGLSEQIKQEIEGMNKEIDKLMADQQDSEFKRLEAMTRLETDQIAKRRADGVINAKEEEELLVALYGRAAAQRVAIAKKSYDDQFKMAVTFGDAIGKITGRMVMGEKDAWKEITDVVIDALVQQIQASIVAGAARAWITEVAGKGFAGLATGAILSGLVAATGEVAKAAIRGGGSTSVPTSGGSGAFTASSRNDDSGSGASVPPRDSATIRVNIYGDMLGDPAVADRLALRISEAVDNRDVRLVSTTVRA